MSIISIRRASLGYYHRNRQAISAKRRTPEFRALHRLYERSRGPRLRTFDEEQKKARLEAGRRWRKKYPEKQRSSYRRWADKNKERLAERQRVWRKLHPERSRELVRQSASRNPIPKKAANLKRKHRIRTRVLMPQAINAFLQRIYAKKTVRCYYCRSRISVTLIHIDHVIAVSLNGSHSPGNLAVACLDCNLRKGAKLPSEIRFITQPLLSL